MFTGREYASTFGIYEYRARAYHPGLGRFISEDPKGFVHRFGTEGDKWDFKAQPDSGELNLFRYCGNDPADLTDPTGEFVVVDDVAEAYLAYTFVAAGVSAYLATPAGKQMLQNVEHFGLSLVNTVKDGLSTGHSPPGDASGGRLDSRSRQPDPMPEAEGRPHTIIERPGAKGQYTTHNGDGTSKQYRGEGKPHGGIPWPNVKETTTHTGPDGKQSTTSIVRPARPEEIPPESRKIEEPLTQPR